MRILGCACLVIACIMATQSISAYAAEGSFDYAPLERTLAAHVTEQGWVDYPALQADRRDLDQFVATLARVSPENLPAMFPSENDRIAYWINAYNAFMLKRVIDKYPIRSIRDMAVFFGVFWRLKQTVGGNEYTLNHIEHDILRKEFNEPRIHFAINCASQSCPRLAVRPYFPQTLDEQLDEAARRFIQADGGVKIGKRDGRLELSKIFDWYKDDFERLDASGKGTGKLALLDYIARYAVPEIRDFISAKKPKIDYLDYDWGLNDASRQPSR